jgi:hypothetical protein
MDYSFDRSLQSENQVAEALPLVQATWRNLEQISWQRYIQSFAGEEATKAGVMTMRDSSGRLCGLFAYNVRQTLQRGLVLDIPLFTAVDLANSLGVVGALVAAAEKQAFALNCAALEIRLTPDQSQLHGRLRSLGLSVDASLLGKPVSCERESG